MWLTLATPTATTTTLQRTRDTCLAGCVNAANIRSKRACEARCKDAAKKRKAEPRSEAETAEGGPIGIKTSSSATKLTMAIEPRNPDAPSAVEQRISNRVAAIRACYGSALGDKPARAGRAKIAVSVKTDGALTAKLVEPATERALATCVAVSLAGQKVRPQAIPSEESVSLTYAPTP